MVQQRADRPRNFFQDAKALLSWGRPKPCKRNPIKSSSASAVDPTATQATDMEYPRDCMPRMYFTGKFYTNPSTVNNFSGNYDVEHFRPNNQILRDQNNLNGSWNPDGTATFALVDCEVTGTFSPSAVPDDHVTPLQNDIIVGEHIEYNRRSVYGKISDLDSQMQNVSALYGVRVNLGTLGTDDSFSSLLMPTSFRDMWGGVYNPNPKGHMGAYIRGYSAVYQGLLNLDTFQPKNSTFLSECEPYVNESKKLPNGGDSPYKNGALSIRFRVDWYNNDPDHEDFCYGNVSGYITTYLPGYPLTFDLGRQLYTTLETENKITFHVDTNGDGDEEEVTVTTPLCNMAYASIEKVGDKRYLFVDLVNSLYRKLPTGKVTNDPHNPWHSPYPNLGTLEIGYLPVQWYPDTDEGDSTFTSLAKIPYNLRAFDAASCVMTIDVTDHVEEFKSCQLAVRSTNGSTSKLLLAEAEDGLFARADNFVFHLQGNGNSVEAKIFCSMFGYPQADQNITVGFDSSAMQTDGQAGKGPTVGTPISALKINNVQPTGDADDFSTTVKTLNTGFAPLILQGLDCGNPRGYIDGQLYGLRYAAGEELPKVDGNVPNNEKVNMLLFNVFKGPVTTGSISWVSDILPIFQQYSNLYPSMHSIVRLDDYGSVVMRREALLRAFNTPQDDPRYMPTTRDLSEAKRHMIVSWLYDEKLPFFNQNVPDVKAALQTIIELEHSTMPPYLTALYSIKQGYNNYIADTLRDVATQEMLHMALACNILIAIGGAPVINKMGFVPKYPAPLPGGLRSGLIMRLRKCTKEQIQSFVEVEAPEEQYLLEDGVSSENNTAHTKQTNPYTIGWVYNAVLEAMAEMQHNGTLKFPVDNNLGPDSKDPTVAHQIDGAFGDKLFKIMSIDDARTAITQIMTEGEGSPASNNPADGDIDPETGLPILSHYFRFQEIVKGRRLIIGEKTDGDPPTREYAYNGPRLVLNPDGVYNMQDDPKIETQPLGSQQRERMESFARKYQGLLNGLHKAFNGYPDYLNECFALMFQLTISAQQLMELPALNIDGSVKKDGTTCGISFQVPLTDD